MAIWTSVWQFSPTSWKPTLSFSLVFNENQLAKTNSDNHHENHLVKTIQVLTGHQIWKLDRFSHIEKGPILMVKFLKVNN